MEDATERPLSPASTDRAVDAILGDNTVVHVKDIPDAYLNYEKEHGIAILNDFQVSSLRVAVAALPEFLEIGRDDLHGLLSTLLNSVKETQPSSPSQSVDLATPTTEVATPTTAKHERRKSTRIRTQSDTESTEEEEQTPSRGSMSSAAGKRPIPRRSFPGDSSSYMLPSTIATSPEGALPPRPKKLSDASNKFEQRYSRDDPPSAYMPLGRRPVPQSRRSSSNTFSVRSDDGATPDAAYKGHGRSTSGASVVSPSARSPRATSPISPAGDGYGSDVSDDIEWRTGDLAGPSLDHALEKAREADEVRRLTASVAELKNRIKSLEHERELAQQTHEDLVADMEQRAQNERQEHDNKVKDQMGRAEQKYRTEIEAKESEIAEINESLDAMSAKLADIQAALENEKNKAAELRDTIEDREKDISDLRMELDLASDQKEQLEEELGKLNQTNVDLQEKVVASRAVEQNLAAKVAEIKLLEASLLDVNRQLSDLKGGASYGGGLSGVSSAGPATLTRNGGSQLSSELQAAEDPQIQTIYLDRETTHTITRTIHAGSRSSATYADAGTETDAIDLLHDPEFAPLVEQAIRQRDATEEDPEGAKTPVQSQSTLAEEALRSPPAYSAAPGPLDADALIKHTHPEVTKGRLRSDEDVQKAYDLVSKATGKRCHVFEDAMESEEILRDKHESVGDGKPGMVNRIVNWATAIGAVQIGGLLALTVLATQVFGTPPQRDPYDSFAYNGYVSWFDHTAAMARAGRVPT